MTDETVVEADGIRVTKSFDADGFPVPAVRFDVTSTRDDETTLTITDEIPDEFDIDQIGFHPEYGSEHWTATGDGVVRFERTVDGSEKFTTVYGVRMGDDEEPAAFLDSPTVTVGDEAPASGIDDIVPPESSDIVRELAGGKRESIPGLEDESADDAAEAETTQAATADAGANEPLLDALHEDDDIVDAEEVEPAVTAANNTDVEADADSDEETEAADAAEDDEPTVDEVAAGGAEANAENDDEESEAGDVEDAQEPATETDTDDGVVADADDGVTTEAATMAAGEAADNAESDDTSGEVVVVDVENVAAALAEQLREENIADDDLDVLRTQLAPKRSEVQLEHLQSRVSEMEAYADALGAFIDENGDARGILEDLQSDVESMQSTVQAFDEASENAEAERIALKESIESVEDQLGALDDVNDRLDRVSGDLEALDDRVEGVEDAANEVEDVKDELESVREDVEEFRQWRSQLSDVFGG